MFKAVNVIGRGRVGPPIALRLAERGIVVRETAADLVLLGQGRGAAEEEGRQRQQRETTAADILSD